MSHSNISIFIPHAGCEHNCIFCNQHIISGAEKPPTAVEVKAEIKTAISKLKNPENTEIAFFGGSFTCLPDEYMTSLLAVAWEAVRLHNLAGIRISTRPDAITPDILDTLESFGVTAIELGAQSMSDEVLRLNRRGHTALDVVKAVALIKERFEFGLQMMTGMYGSNADTDMKTAKAIAKLAPDTVRIYPTVVIKGTELEKVWEQTTSLDEMVSIVAAMVSLFETENIRIIRVGLHASETLEADITGGYYHPAFGELVENEIFFRLITEKLTKKGAYIIYVHPKNISKAIGQKSKNITKLSLSGYDITVRPDETLTGRREIRAKHEHIKE
ncbi:MAG: radical SAM protein [Ruminococcus sp.]|jgi:histone acetyltransferase (RNA polymerase elongator complex component)|nr:radical SAM protein [Ruminococcus sp.]